MHQALALDSAIEPQANLEGAPETSIATVASQEPGTNADANSTEDQNSPLTSLEALAQAVNEPLAIETTPEAEQPAGQTLEFAENTTELQDDSHDANAFEDNGLGDGFDEDEAPKAKSAQLAMGVIASNKVLVADTSKNDSQDDDDGFGGFGDDDFNDDFGVPPENEVSEGELSATSVSENKEIEANTDNAEEDTEANAKNSEEVGTIAESETASSRC